MIILIQTNVFYKEDDLKKMEIELSEKTGAKVVLVNPNINLNTLQILHS